MRIADDKRHGFMGHQICVAGHRFGPAIRDCYLLHFVLRGKGILRTEEGEFFLEEGEGFLISPDEVTTYIADGENPWEYFWVGVDANSESEAVLYRHGLEKGVHCFWYRDQDQLLPYLKSMAAEQTVYDNEKAMGAFYLLMSTLAIRENYGTVKGDNYLQRCYDYMESTYADRLTVEGMAACLNISRSYLYRIIKQELGLSPQRMILNFRLEKAAALMEKSNASLTDIALSCGFCDLSHFSKAYKDKYHIRPGEGKLLQDINVNEK